MARVNAVAVVKSVFDGFAPGSTAGSSIDRLISGATDGKDAVDKLVRSGYLRKEGIYPTSSQLRDLQKAFDKAM